MAAAPQLLVFDSRRGNREGEEEAKVLAFHPAGTPAVEQISIAGLLQGLLLFSSNFSEVGARPAGGQPGGLTAEALDQSEGPAPLAARCFSSLPAHAAMPMRGLRTLLPAGLLGGGGD